MVTRCIRGITAVMLVVQLVFGSVGTSYAQTVVESFTLPVGGQATIQFEAYCTNYGLRFPTAIQAPDNMAEMRTQAALVYIQNNNLSADQATALEAQYAIWQLRGAKDSPEGGPTTAAVVNAADTMPVIPQGTSLVDAVKAGQVRVTITNWQPIGEKVQIGSAVDNFYGRGTLTVENTSNQELTLYMPVGTLFPPATAGDQAMAGYQTSVQLPQVQPTVAPTTEATAAATTVPTTEATAAATVAPTTEATAAATIVPTTVPTTEATAAATIVPTAAATIVPTAAATTRATATPGNLPTTSDTSANTLLVLLLGALLLGFGVLITTVRRNT